MGRMARRGLCSAAFAVAWLGIAPAHGAEVTREEYVSRAETICEVGAAKTTPLIEKGFREVQDGEVRSAAPKMTRASVLFEQYRRRLVALPRPAPDADDLRAWLKQLDVQNEFLARAGEALAEDKRVKAQGYFTRFVHYGNVARDLVLGFGFKSCLFSRKVR